MAALTQGEKRGRVVPSPKLGFVDQIDFASASLEELRSLHDLADHIGTFAYALVWTGRCQPRGSRGEFNIVGKLMQRIGDALTDVETAANTEAARRTPDDSYDRGRRLAMLAPSIIDNSDPDETTAFSRELAAHAEAERAGR